MLFSGYKLPFLVSFVFACTQSPLLAQDSNATLDTNTSVNQTNIKPGRILGRVFDDDTGEALSGVTVVFEDKSIETKTDLEGRYRQSNLEPGIYSLLFFKEGYTRTRVPKIHLEPGRTKLVDLPMIPDYSDLESLDAFEINAADLENTEIELLSTRREAIVLSDSIGADFFSRAGVGDVAAAMTKVTGANVVGGKYAVIRGLGDRYSNTTLNGAPIPSSDPSKRAVQLDLFPTDLVDSIVTTKSFTPDKPGDFTGGNVDVRTKSFPDIFYLNAGVSIKINPNALGEEMLYAPNLEISEEARTNTRSYESLPDTATTNNGYYSNDSSERQSAGDFLHSGFVPIVKDGEFDRSVSLNIGNTLELDDTFSLGLVGAFSQGRSFTNIKQKNSGRYERAGQNLADYLVLTGQESSESVNLNGLVGVSLLAGEKHDFSMTFMHNRSAEQIASSESGSYNGGSVSFPERIIRNSGLNDTYGLSGTASFTAPAIVYYHIDQLEQIEREMTTGQLRGKHELNEGGAEADWFYSRSETSEDRPDARQLPGFLVVMPDQSSVNTWEYLGNARSLAKQFSGIKEEGDSWKVDLSLPVKIQAENLDSLTFKTGLARSDFDRLGYGKRYSLNVSRTNWREVLKTADQVTEVYDNTNNWQELWSELTIADSSSKPFGYQDKTMSSNTILNYQGVQRVKGKYGMLDIRFMESWRASLGVRSESTFILSNPIAGSYNFSLGSVEKLTGEIDGSDTLPAFSLTWEHGSEKNMNLRFAYGETLARPTFFEFTPVRLSNEAEKYTVEGNPSLRRTLVENYDLRWEWFPTEGEIVSVGIFNKEFIDPIVSTANFLSTTALYSWTNANAGTIRGLEVEARKNFMDFYQIGANLTLVDSELSELDSFATGSNTTFQGQPSYIFNFDLGISLDEYQLTSNLFFNFVGEYLESVSAGNIPNIMKKENMTLDFNLKKTFADHWSLKLSAQNLLDPEQVTFYEGFEDKVHSSYKKGRAFGLSVSWEY